MAEEAVKKNILKLVNLNLEDKTALLQKNDVGYGHAQSILSYLSCFATVPPPKIWRNVKVWHYEGDIYYLPFKHRTDLGIFVNAHGKIIYGSRYFTTHLINFSIAADRIIASASTLNKDAAVNLNGIFIAIEKWYITYGHFKDEAFTLGAYLDDLGASASAKALLDYPTDSGLDSTSFKFNNNYCVIEGTIFNGRSVNVYNIEGECFRINGLTLIENGFNGNGFHRFPNSVRDRIKSSATTKFPASGIRKLFLTRSDSYRDPENKAEIDAYMRQNGFNVVNPENISYEAMIALAASVEIVVMFYGSALTNMIYFAPNTRVIILKSQSYMEESINLWKKVIDGYQLVVDVIPARENRILMQELSSSISS